MVYIYIYMRDQHEFKIRHAKMSMSNVEENLANSYIDSNYP